MLFFERTNRLKFVTYNKLQQQEEQPTISKIFLEINVCKVTIYRHGD